MYPSRDQPPDSTATSRTITTIGRTLVGSIDLSSALYITLLWTIATS
jgi:hypothetical protein